MNLTLVGLSVVLNFWRREFYNALAGQGLARVPGTAFLLPQHAQWPDAGLLSKSPASTSSSRCIRSGLNQFLQIRWRRWLTRQFLHEWLADRAYYNISLTADRAAVGTDNPDQRVAEDLRDFTQMR